MSAVDACIQALRRNPQMHGLVYENYRRALVWRFPYSVFYQVVGDLLTVYGIMHTAQDPQKWRDRLA